MIQSLDFVGPNAPVAAASGAWISMVDCRAVTFIAFEDDGSTILTLNQATDNAGTGAAALAAIDKVVKFPGTGGAYTEVTQTAAETYDNADDTVNDAFAITVLDSDLTDGNTHIRAAVDGGILMAIRHSLVHPSRPNRLESPIA